MGATTIGKRPGSLQRSRVTRELTWLVPVLVTLSLASFVIGLLAFINELPASRLHAEVTALTHRADALETQVRSQARALTLERRRRTAAERATQSALAKLQATLRVSASVADLNALHASLYRLAQCIPQLQRQLATLRLETTDVNGWLTGATLTRPGLSSACTGGL